METTFNLYVFNSAFEVWNAVSEHDTLGEAYAALADELSEDKKSGDVYRYRITEGRTIYEDDGV